MPVDIKLLHQLRSDTKCVDIDPDPHGEHVTTYGTNPRHCGIAADIGNFLKYKIMGWVNENNDGGEIV